MSTYLGLDRFKNTVETEGLLALMERPKSELIWQAQKLMPVADPGCVNSVGNSNFPGKTRS